MNLWRSGRLVDALCRVDVVIIQLCGSDRT